LTSLKILFASAEVAPVVKVGGLADVAGSLPQAIHQLGHDIRLVMPAYGSIDRDKYKVIPITEFNIHFMGSQQPIGISKIELSNNVPLYIVENQKYFGHAAVYGEHDDLERFVFFSQAIMELPNRIGWQPDILHCQDWHAALAVPLLKNTDRNKSAWSECASVFTIHNLAYQGWFDDDFANKVGITQFLLPYDHPLRPKVFSTMALAIIYADIVSTVSPTYAREILTTRYGEKIELLLQQRCQDLYGIINGLDYEQFNPATDPSIVANYDINSLQRRMLNKQALQSQGGLDIVDTSPLVGMVSRLSAQKGIDLVAEALVPLLEATDIQFVFLGTGDEKYRQPLEVIANSFPKRVKLFYSFNTDLAQLIYAGCDMFIMPSLFEPCGLGQLIALRYGAIPVVRRTGGLADTVQDVSPDLSTGNGFVFEEYNYRAFIEAVKRSVSAYKKKSGWRQLMIRGMAADYSWKASALKYQELYIRAKNKLANT
jgi:starch synthase